MVATPLDTITVTGEPAAVAALMIQSNSTLTPAQIYSALQASALPMGSTTPDDKSGYGFIQADKAVTAVMSTATTTTTNTPATSSGGGGGSVDVTVLLGLAVLGPIGAEVPRAGSDLVATRPCKAILQRQ